MQSSLLALQTVILRSFEDLYITCDWQKLIYGALFPSIFTTQINRLEAVQFIYREIPEL